MESKSFKIDGMTCAACANRVERFTKKVDGVESAAVNFATETLTVEYDKDKVNSELIEQTVDKAGYKVRKNIQSYNLKVEGMTCAACSSRVERVTRKLPGVIESTVNLATERLNITINADELSYGQIKAAVEKSGYKLVKEEEQTEEETKPVDKSKVMLHRFIWSCVFTVPLFIIAMGHDFGMPLPSIISPSVNPLNFAILELVLTIPVMIAGSKFYKIGIKNLFHLSPNMDSSVEVVPSITSPSTGNFSPGFTTIISFTTTSSIGITISVLFLITVAVFGAKPISLFIAWDVFPFETVSKYLPKVIRVKIVAAESK